MHPSSIKNMEICRNMILSRLPEKPVILDVGGRSLVPEKDRSYLPVWKDYAGEYLIADTVRGLGVTHVMKGPYSLPFKDDSVDVVVSGQVLEHVKNPFRLVSEMTRVTREWVVIIAPSAGPRHDDVDCWRFMDDAFAAIAEETGGIDVFADWVDNAAEDVRSAKWKDHVFIGRKMS